MNRNIAKYFIYLSISTISYVLYVTLNQFVKEGHDYNYFIVILSWIGILLWILIIISWKKETGKYFTPYTIFILFVFMFNFGQCLMWAIGIHLPTEIGKSVLYSGWGMASDSDIIRVQLLTLICILMFHVGALFRYKGKRVKNSIKDDDDKITLLVMYKICLFLSLIVFPVTIYYAFNDLQVARSYGYRALYYSEFANSGGILQTLASGMFFACIAGILIGGNFSKKPRMYVYTVFGIYLAINMLAGDRGSWVYILVILIWLSHFCLKSINIKKLLIYGISAFVSLYVIDAMVSLRNTGITYANVINSLSLKNSPIVETIFEMGSSMTPAIILQKYGWDIWPYANSYILAVVTMVSNKVLTVLNVPFETIGSWFSQSYLGIRYGAGFSIFAEALMNFGPYVAPFVLIVIGFMISSLIYIDKSVNYKKRPLKVFFVVLTLQAMLPLARGYFHYQLKAWFLGVLIPTIIIYILSKFVRSRGTN